MTLCNVVVYISYHKTCICSYTSDYKPPSSRLWGWLSWLGIVESNTDVQEETDNKPQTDSGIVDSNTDTQETANELQKDPSRSSTGLYSGATIPEMQQLQLIKHGAVQVRIMDKISYRWQEVAIALGFKGYEIETIKQSTHHQPSDACMTMFTKWLEGGKREPVTWETLVHALTEAKFQTLAQQIQAL